MTLKTKWDVEGHLRACRLQFSPLGLVAAQILSEIFHGPHHLDPATLQKTRWEDTHAIEYQLGRRQLATFDFDELTRLVVMAHDACVRIAVSPGGRMGLALFFHRREREGEYTQRHPTLEEAMMKMRGNYQVESGVPK
jgi:hypothetical protein